MGRHSQLLPWLALPLHRLAERKSAYIMLVAFGNDHMGAKRDGREGPRAEALPSGERGGEAVAGSARKIVWGETVLGHSVLLFRGQTRTFVHQASEVPNPSRLRRKLIDPVIRYQVERFARIASSRPGKR